MNRIIIVSTVNRDVLVIREHTSHWYEDVSLPSRLRLASVAREIGWKITPYIDGWTIHEAN